MSVHLESCLERAKYVVSTALSIFSSPPNKIPGYSQVLL